MPEQQIAQWKAGLTQSGPVVTDAEAVQARARPELERSTTASTIATAALSQRMGSFYGRVLLRCEWPMTCTAPGILWS